MKKFKVSLIMPCYKVEKYLPKCLDTLVNQTLDGVEVIAINDGSPDNCLNILHEYQKKFTNNNELVIIDKENEGVWKGRFDGIKIARGDYIGFVDSDDYVSVDFAKKLYDEIKKSKTDIAICGFDRIDLDTGKLYSHEMCKFKYKKIDISKDSGLMLEINGSPWNKLFKKDLLKKMHKMEHIPKVLDDMMFISLAYVNAKSISFIDDSLYYYMVRKDSIINTINMSKLPSVYEAMKEVRSVYEKRSELLDYIDAAAFLHLKVSLMYRIYSDKTIDFNKVNKENTRYLKENFPNYLNNKYLKLNWILKHKKVNFKLWIVKIFNKLGLFKLFLALYTFMIKHIGIDIKW